MTNIHYYILECRSVSVLYVDSVFTIHKITKHRGAIVSKSDCEPVRFPSYEKLSSQVYCMTKPDTCLGEISLKIVSCFEPANSAC